MKFASFLVGDRPSYGVIIGDDAYDLGRRLGPAHPTLRSAIAAGVSASAAREAAAGSADCRLAEVKLLPPITDPEKIVCVGLNYKAHAAEGGFKIPEYPMLFLRLTNTLVPHEGAMIRPRLSTDFDFEGEFAVIIGRGGRNIAREDALKHVFGYACFNDASVRDYQFKHCLTVGKNFPATGGFGPWITTADEIPDPAVLTLVTRLNGREVQRGPLSDLIFDVPTIIEYVSTFTELVPGDVISTGTPHGVGLGRKPPLWMKAGDTVEVEVAGIGVLTNPVVAEAQPVAAG